MSRLADRSVPPLRLVPRAAGDDRQVDRDLVVRLQGGDRTAAVAIWDRHAGRVHRFLLRALTQSSEEVEDLTQEIFLRIFTRPRAIREPAALREFVMSVAVRVLRWELRRRWVRRWVRLTPTGAMPDTPVEGAADEEARQALRRCYAILDGLGERERVAFVLRQMEGMKMEEVAEQMRVSVSTAKRLVSRGVAHVAAGVAQDADLRGYFEGAPSGRHE
ncbi:MAG TPA: RNA polymerase sigma factor [Polyangia bacterium]|nr:RNA polymerase sigma factor [Polyangia bacterium]